MKTSGFPSTLISLNCSIIYFRTRETIISSNIFCLISVATFLVSFLILSSSLFLNSFLRSLYCFIKSAIGIPFTVKGVKRSSLNILIKLKISSIELLSGVAVRSINLFGKLSLFFSSFLAFLCLRVLLFLNLCASSRINKSYFSASLSTSPSFMFWKIPRDRKAIVPRSFSP